MQRIGFDAWLAPADGEGAAAAPHAEGRERLGRRLLVGPLRPRRGRRVLLHMLKPAYQGLG